MKSLVILKYVFAVVGSAIMAGSFFWYTETKSFIGEAQTAPGVVIELVSSRNNDSITYQPVVEFTTEKGQKIEFTSSVGSNPPSHSEGDQIEVLYHENTPQKAKINSFFSLWFGPILLLIFGSIFSIVGFGLLLYPRLKSKKIEKLKQKGSIVQAQYTSVNQNTYFGVNNRHPYQIIAQWQHPETSKIHIFKSKYLWFDPSKFIHTKELTVWVDMKKPKNHYIDVSFLPELAE